MAYLFIGLFIGLIIGCLIGSLAVAIQAMKHEISRLNKEIKNEKEVQL